MAGENKGPLRHIVLLKVEKKEDVPEVVATLANMSKEIVNHVSWLSFDINSELGSPLSITPPSSKNNNNHISSSHATLWYFMRVYEMQQI
jgi:hypothetical protein